MISDIYSALYTNKCQLFHIATSDWIMLPAALNSKEWGSMKERQQREALVNAVLAVVGTVYAVNGPQMTREFVDHYLVKEIPSAVLDRLLTVEQNPISLFNELIAGISNALPKRMYV